jgi:hypothetical protein
LAIICAAFIAVAADSVSTTRSWRAPDGTTFQRGEFTDGLGWEAVDANGDGQPDVVTFLCGTSYTRIEIDTDGNQSADRVYLFAPDGASTGYLDANGDGVLERPGGDHVEQARALHEIGRGGALFRRALEMRYYAEAGLLQPDEKPAPKLTPPFTRATGVTLRFELRLTLVPAGPASPSRHAQNPIGLGRFLVAANAGVGKFFASMPLEARTDPTAESPDVTGRLAAFLYPVWTEQPVTDGHAERRLQLQLTGRLEIPRRFDELFFFTATVDDDHPATLHTPVRDRSGRPNGTLLLEIRKID